MRKLTSAKCDADREEEGARNLSVKQRFKEMLLGTPSSGSPASRELRSREFPARHEVPEAQLAELVREREQSELLLKRAKDELASRESHYQAMINSFEGYIYICSPDYRIEFMNERMKERLGRDATGEACHEALHDLDSVCNWCVNDRVLAGENVPWDIKSPKDGRWYHVSNTPIFHPDGTVSKQALITDITERKINEEAIAESTETLKLLMDMMPVGVGWHDYQGNVEYLNQSFVKLFGYTLDDIRTAEDWLKLAYQDPAERDARRAYWQNAITQSRADGTPIPPTETKVRCKDGSVRHIIRHIELARHRVLNTFVDITERELIQEERLKMQKLESLGVLAGGIAHDFNNILTAILGNITFARMILSAPDKTDQADKILQSAEKASERAVELSNQLMAFAKGSKPVKKIVSVQRLVNESVNLMLRGANVKGALQLPLSLHAVEADEGQINQAFNNLILNAVQAMPNGGTLTVQAENVTLESANLGAIAPGNYVKLSFSDEGGGITKEHLKKVFDPYFSTKTGGKGLGLASTQSIITKHGGHLGVRSETGKGTTFLIHLPSIGVSYTELCTDKEHLGAASHLGGAILIMDDDGPVVNLAKGILEFFGYQVTTCNSGEAAIQLYQANREAGRSFLAVIMDLTIPGAMGGKEAAQRILELDPKARMVVSSGYSNDPVMAKFQSHGFCAALPKPYKVEEIERVLAALPKD
jgi:two-component system, cell cycle sensor histidine kinase and response regulator CckA